MNSDGPRLCGHKRMAGRYRGRGHGTVSRRLHLDCPIHADSAGMFKRLRRLTVGPVHENFHSAKTVSFFFGFRRKAGKLIKELVFVDDLGASQPNVIGWSAGTFTFTSVSMRGRFSHLIFPLISLRVSRRKSIAYGLFSCRFRFKSAMTDKIKAIPLKEIEITGSAWGGASTRP